MASTPPEPEPLPNGNVNGGGLSSSTSEYRARFHRSLTAPSPFRALPSSSMLPVEQQQQQQSSSSSAGTSSQPNGGGRMAIDPGLAPVTSADHHEHVLDVIMNGVGGVDGPTGQEQNGLDVRLDNKGTAQDLDAQAQAAHAHAHAHAQAQAQAQAQAAAQIQVQIVRNWELLNQARLQAEQHVRELGRAV